MRNIIKLAFRNFFRNTRRSIISCVGVAIAIAVVIFAHGYLRGVTESIIDNVVRLVSGHVRITTREYERRERMLPLSEAIDITPEFIASLDNPDIQAITARIKFGVMLGEGEAAVPALGYAVEPEKETAILGFDKRIIRGSYLEGGDKAVILGKELASRLGLDVGDTLTIITRTAYDSPAGMNLLVKGVYSTGLGGVDRSVFYMPLKRAQELLDLEGKATEVVIIARDRSKAPLIAREIRVKCPDCAVVPYQENSILQYMRSSEVSFVAFYLIILLVACSTIANTMLMIVFERAREIGMLKALGMGNVSIVSMLLLEALFIGFTGSVVGTGIGAAFSYFFKYRGIDFSMFMSVADAEIPFGPVIYFSPTPVLIFAAFLLGLFASVIVAYLPVRRVTKLDPARSLRTV